MFQKYLKIGLSLKINGARAKLDVLILYISLENRELLILIPIKKI